MNSINRLNGFNEYMQNTSPYWCFEPPPPSRMGGLPEGGGGPTVGGQNWISIHKRPPGRAYRPFWGGFGAPWDPKIEGLGGPNRGPIFANFH